MKVICVDNKDFDGSLIPVLNIGSEYTVVFKGVDVRQPENGNYYKLAEINNGQCYHESLFAPLSEIDELELVNEKEEVV